MDMQGLSAQFPAGEAAVRALEAGADVLLMPPKPEEAVNAVVAAVKSGRLSARRIDQSVARILAAKARVGLHRKRLVDIEAIGDVIDAPDGVALAQAHADAAMTLVKNDGDLLPLKQPGAACYVVLAENRFGMQGRRFLDELRRRQPKASATLLDRRCPKPSSRPRPRACRNVKPRWSLAFAGFPKLVESLIATGKPVALVAFGNPYLLRKFPRATAYLAAFSTTPTSEAAAIKALFGEIPIRGKLPVSIPGLAAIGDGIQLPAR